MGSYVLITGKTNKRRKPKTVSLCSVRKPCLLAQRHRGLYQYRLIVIALSLGNSTVMPTSRRTSLFRESGIRINAHNITT